MEQNSNLKRGLIFHAPLDEWNGSRDLISKQLGTATDVYPVLGRSGKGRRWYNFNGTSDYVALPTIPAFGTSDFSVIVNFKVLSLVEQNIIGGDSSMFELTIVDGNIYQSKIAGTTRLKVTDAPLIIGLDYTITYKRSGITGTLYVNKIPQTSISDASDYTIPNTRLSRFSNTYPNSINGSISMFRIFNYALSPIQIANYSKPEYPIEWVDRGTGANKNILDLNAEGMNTATWIDKTNSLTSIVSGAKYVKPVASNLGLSYSNGTTSKVAFTGMNGLTGDITITGKIRLNTFGGGDTGRIIDNTKCALLVSSSGYLLFTRDGATIINSGAASIAINTDYDIMVTSTSAGVTNFYINKVLSRTANQSAGTPVGATDLNLLNNAASTASFDGLISDVLVHNRIVQLEEII